MAKKARKQLIIFAEEISENVMSTLIYNNKKKIVEACGISVPAHGEAGKQALKQITEVTKSYPFTQFSDRKITEIEWEDFGKVRRIEIDKFETKIESISQEEENVNAIIMVGGVTETVMLEKYDLIVDALNSGKSAKKDGVVPGGGVAMWKLAELLEQYRGEGEAGVKILAEVLKVPRKKLTQFVDPDKQPLSGTEWEGFDVRNQKKVDMFEAGIVDSLNVTKSTLIDAISLCSVLI
jgi:chaperonin GroEL